MPKNISIALISIFISSVLFSQAKIYVYYFDAHLNNTDKSKSVLTGKGVMVDGQLKMIVTENVTHKTVLLANFQDTTLSNYVGLYKAFYLNGRKNIEGKYNNGMMEGVWRQWDSSGRIVDSSTYSHDRKLDSTLFEYYKSGRLAQNKFTDIAHNKQLVKNYNDSGRLVTEIQFLGQSGTRKVYNNGSVFTDSLHSRREDEAKFPGGERAFSLLMQKAITDHVDELTAAGKTGTCIVRFIVDKDGSVTEVEAETMKGTKLAKVAVNAVKHSPRWTPAFQYDKNVKSYMKQPFSFAISDK